MLEHPTEESHGRAVLLASAVASAGWLVGLLAAGYTVFVMVTGGAAAVPLGVALFGVALGVTFSLVENRLTGRGAVR